MATDHWSNFVNLFREDPYLGMYYSRFAPTGDQNFHQGNQYRMINELFGGDVNAYNRWVNDNSPGGGNWDARGGDRPGEVQNRIFAMLQGATPWMRAQQGAQGAVPQQTLTPFPTAPALYQQNGQYNPAAFPGQSVPLNPLLPAPWQIPSGAQTSVGPGTAPVGTVPPPAGTTPPPPPAATTIQNGTTPTARPDPKRMGIPGIQQMPTFQNAGTSMQNSRPAAQSPYGFAQRMPRGRWGYQ